MFRGLFVGRKLYTRISKFRRQHRVFAGLRRIFQDFHWISDRFQPEGTRISEQGVSGDGDGVTSICVPIGVYSPDNCNVHYSKYIQSHSKTFPKFLRNGQKQKQKLLRFKFFMMDAKT